MPFLPPDLRLERSAGDIGRTAAALTIVAALAIGSAIAPRRSPPPPGAGTRLTLLPLTLPTNGRASAYIVAQPRDCTGNLEFLSLFERPPIRDRVTLAGAIALGGPAAADSIRRALATHDLHLPVLHSTSTFARLLATLGYHSTPYLLVLGPDGALRYAIDAPTTRFAWRRLAADLQQLGALAPPPDTNDATAPRP